MSPSSTAVVALALAMGATLAALALRYARIRLALRWLLGAWWGGTWRLAVLALALLALPVSKRGARWLARKTLPGKPDPGRQVGYLTGDRGSGNVPEARIRPVSAQRVASSEPGAAQRYGVHAMSGPGQLALWVGASGMGKTELRLGTWRAQFDEVPFCGLPTTKGGRKLWLTEMERDLARDYLRRWGFLVEPKGKIDRVRLNWWTPRGSPGDYLHIEYASEVFTPDSETGATTDWPRVLARLVASGAGEKYDEIAVDTFAEWLGSDNNDAASESLGLCKQLTKRGAGVTILHHTPMSDPTRQKGGMGVLRAIDVGWALYGVGAGAQKRALKDPERYLACFKARRQEDAPDAPLRIIYDLASPAAGVTLPRYRLVTGAPVTPVVVSTGATVEPPAPALTDRQRRVLDELRGAADHAATTPEISAAAGLDGDRARETLVALSKRGLVEIAGTAPAHEKGSKPATIWRLTELARTGTASDPATRLLHEALDAHPSTISGAPGGDA